MGIWRKLSGAEDAESPRGGDALALDAWRSLSARRTEAFVQLAAALRSVDAPRPTAAPPQAPHTCPSGHPCGQHETLLLRACCLGAVEETRALLRFGADPNRCCANGYTPLHHSALACSVDCMQALFEDQRTDVNAQSPEGRDALHVCVRQPSLEEEDNKLLLRSIEALLQHPNFLPNKVDFLAQTPIIYALNRYYEDRVSVMLTHGAGKIDLDWTTNRGQPLRETIRKKFPKLVPLMSSITEELDIKDIADPNKKLLLLLKKKELDLFKNLLAERKLNLDYLYGDPFYGTIIEIASRVQGFEAFVEVLLSSGANANTVNRISRFPLVHQAASCANYEVMKMLLNTDAFDITKVNSYRETVLHVATRISPTEEATGELENVIEMLLDFKGERGNRLDVDARDGGGDTALFNAASFGLDAVVLQLLRRGADMGVCVKGGDPLLVSIDKDTLRTHLDEQISSNGLSQRNELFQLVFRYDSLVPTSPNNDMLAEMNIVSSIADSEDLRPLLRHPLISTFLFLKWSNVKKFVIYNLIICLLFVISLTSYSLLLPKTSIGNEGKVYEICNRTVEDRVESGLGELIANNSQSPVLSTVSESVRGNSTNCEYREDDEDMENSLELKLLRIPIFFFLIIMLIREGTQFFFHKFRYFLSVENIMELLLIFGTAVTVFSQFFNDSWDRHVSGIVILLAWAELILVSGGLPIFSIQLEMFKEVTRTFLRFMAWYSLMILAFAFSFFILFGKNDSNFLDPGMSIFRTVIMMTGEFDSSDLPFDELPVTSHLIFIIFVGLIAIVLLNLLNGLAVYDTQAIQEDAAVLSLVSMVRIVNYMESFLHKLVLICEKIKLGEVKTHFLSQTRIFEPLNGNKQLTVFASDGNVDFLLDSRTTRKFRGFRLEKSVLEAAKDIVINQNQQKHDIKRVIRDLYEELKKIQNQLGKVLENLNMSENM